MTFKYSVVLPISSGNKISRFRAWASEHLPSMAYSVPLQTPIKTVTMTVRLRSIEEGQLLLAAFATSPRL